MKRGLFIRLKAKQAIVVPKEEKKVLASGIELFDADGIVAKYYESVEEAVADGNDENNIHKALKNGTKYKGYLWNYAK